MNNETHICGEIRRFYRTFFSVNSQEWTLSQHGWEVLRRLPQMEIWRTNIICWGKPKALEHPLIDLAFRSNNRIQGIAHRVRTERLCVCMYVCAASADTHLMMKGMKGASPRGEEDPSMGEGYSRLSTSSSKNRLGWSFTCPLSLNTHTHKQPVTLLLFKVLPISWTYIILTI